MTYAVVGKFAKYKGLASAKDERKPDVDDWQDYVDSEEDVSAEVAKGEKRVAELGPQHS